MPIPAVARPAAEGQMHSELPAAVELTLGPSTSLSEHKNTNRSFRANLRHVRHCALQQRTALCTCSWVGWAGDGSRNCKAAHKAVLGAVVETGQHSRQPGPGYHGGRRFKLCKRHGLHGPAGLGELGVHISFQRGLEPLAAPPSACHGNSSNPPEMRRRRLQRGGST